MSCLLILHTWHLHSDVSTQFHSISLKPSFAGRSSHLDIEMIFMNAAHPQLRGGQWALRGLPAVM